MKFVLDAMGGDNAPNAAIQGALRALSVTPNEVSIILIGDKNTITKAFNGIIPDRISIHHTLNADIYQPILTLFVDNNTNDENETADDLSAGNVGLLIKYDKRLPLFQLTPHHGHIFIQGFSGVSGVGTITGYKFLDEPKQGFRAQSVIGNDHDASTEKWRNLKETELEQVAQWPKMSWLRGVTS